jgi:hypothetical protein
MNTVLPKYRSSSILSTVVMSSAFLLLGKQFLSWETAFRFNPVSGVYESSTTLYSNGFRILNWCIDVPCLLAQLAVVTRPAKSEEPARQVLTRNFTIAGLLMVLLGYVGQFYEDKSDMTIMIIFGVAACVPFGYILYAALTELNYALTVVPRKVHWMVRTCQAIFIACWVLGYTLAFFLPAISFTVESVIARTLLYTFSDITSKVIYGILLTQICQARSDAERDPASSSTDGATAVAAPAHIVPESKVDALKSAAGTTA